MYTQCPECATVYEVTPEDLAVAGGLVRCGSCQGTFNALRRLREGSPVAARESHQASLEFGQGRDRHRTTSSPPPTDVDQDTNEVAELPEGGAQDAASLQDAAPGGDDIDQDERRVEKDRGSDEAEAEDSTTDAVESPGSGREYDKISDDDAPDREGDRQAVAAGHDGDEEQIVAETHDGDQEQTVAEMRDSDEEQAVAAMHDSHDAEAQASGYDDDDLDLRKRDEDQSDAVEAEPESYADEKTADVETREQLGDEDESAEETEAQVRDRGDDQDTDDAGADDGNDELSENDEEEYEYDGRFPDEDDSDVGDGLTAEADEAAYSNGLFRDVLTDQALDPNRYQLAETPADTEQSAAVEEAVDLNFDDAEDRRDLQHYLKPRATAAKIAAYMGVSAVLLLALAAQAVHHWRRDLALDERYRPWLVRTYNFFGLSLDPAFRATDYRIARYTVVPNNDQPPVLMARATVINQAHGPRPYPLIRLTFSDVFGEPVYVGTFEPDDYLQEAVASGTMLSARGRAEIALDLTDVDSELGASYVFHVCLPLAGDAVECDELVTR